MIEINLLPEELRKIKKPGIDLGELNLDLDKFKFSAIGIFIGLWIFLIVLLFTISFIREKQTTSLLAQESLLAPQKKEVEAFNDEISSLNVKILALGEITKKRTLWAQRLNELSDLVLPSIWFTRIHTDPESRFIIEGSVLSKREEAMATVGKFIENIKEKSVFFKGFKDVKLESVQRKDFEGRDVVDFIVTLYY